MLGLTVVGINLEAVYCSFAVTLPLAYLMHTFTINIIGPYVPTPSCASPKQANTLL